ncbi:unnamed protein product [Owenia fusiformis]|uniref:Large subunit GTPase 1 homolog n=1 Tax=Owenia fusiformis TaxID=6347 RepID=A0A8J1TPS8_OWEFU|nr:unnamed protein product [Owenia fusiformis]
MGKNKKGGSGLGKSIIKDRFGGQKTSRQSSDSFLHTSELDDGYDWGRLNLQSVTEQSNLDDFLATAELAGTEFTAEKLNVRFVNPEQPNAILSKDEKEKIQATQEANKSLLSIPRRPKWDTSTSAEQLENMEKEGFLNWRRALAELQEVEGIVLTPYEKNLDFWRQLWRVIERSDIVVQIVDARNPLLFRCEDLENYVKEISQEKKNMILINKADHLMEDQRKIWGEFFGKQGVHVAFWSAMAEIQRVKDLEAAENEDKETTNNEMEIEADVELDSDNSDDENNETENDGDNSVPNLEHNASNDDTKEVPERTSESTNSQLDTGHTSHSNSETIAPSIPIVMEQLSETSIEDSVKVDTEESVNVIPVNNNSNLLTGDELIELLKTLHTGKKVQEGLTTVGLVGYPNVGKSSTINAILQCKKVPVSATPGRTKHFQTLYVDKTIMLCDCPGLVMPSFVSTKAELVVSGILPIDQMRDHIPPVAFVANHIPKHIIERTYGINLPLPREGEDPKRDPTAMEILNCYGYMRGYMTARGVPDCPRSARYILKDYMNGKLLYCHSPPDVPQDHFQPPLEMDCSKSEESDVTNKKPGWNSSSQISGADMDKAFFLKRESQLHRKGVHGDKGGLREGLQSSSSSVNDKPWKKHCNKGKKQKLRRIHTDLDKH